MPSLAPCSRQPSPGVRGEHGQGSSLPGRLWSAFRDTVEPAPPLFSHHVGFLGVLGFAVGPNIARRRDDFAHVGMETGLPRHQAGRGQRIPLFSDEAGNTEALVSLLPQ